MPRKRKQWKLKNYRTQLTGYLGTEVATAEDRPRKTKRRRKPRRG